MSEILQWSTGLNGYKKHSLHNNHFTTELSECQFEKGRNIDDIFIDHLIDKPNSNNAVEQTTRMVFGQPNAKVPFKIQINEGSNGNSSYIILKWRKNDSGVYDVVPSSSYFLPNLKSY